MSSEGIYEAYGAEAVRCRWVLSASISESRWVWKAVIFFLSNGLPRSPRLTEVGFI